MKKTSTLSFSRKAIADIVAALISLLMLIAFAFYGVFVSGYVTMTLYNWFVIPNFEGLPLFTYWHFAGFSVFLASMLPSEQLIAPRIKKDLMEDNAELKSVGKILFRPWELLAGAWILKNMIEYFA